jgi:hypothetical protein
MSAPSRTREVWGGPVALGVASAVGLVAALVADGAGDVVSWITLAAPVVVAVRYTVPGLRKGTKEGTNA